MNQDIQYQAAQWFVELRDVHISAARWDAFEEWLCACPEHAKAYQQMRDTWGKAVQMRKRQLGSSVTDIHAGAFTRGIPAISGKWVPARRLGRTLAYYSVKTAALVAGIACLSWIPNGLPDWDRYQTTVGERMEAKLPDGTEIELNTGTRLVTRVTASTRQVIVQQGEALFHVAHDEKRPFTVRVGRSVITDVGTAFSVRIRTEGATEVLVTEGRVDICALDTANITDRAALSSGTSTQLSVGEIVSISSNPGEGATSRVSALTPEEVARKLAWTSDQLRFDGETLAEAVTEFNRYNRLQLVIADPEIANYKVGGDFNTHAPDSFVRATEKLLLLKAEYGGPSTILLSRSRKGSGISSNP